ncbi:hypothetical protein JXQ31_00975, partial [candidate division KSB1 bacterium]|nr:hypothetical protein [candidate division KSB1 bacterium]
MLKKKILTGIIFLIVLSVVTLPGSTLAQKTCVFISKSPDPGDSRDSTLIDHLKQTYDVARIVGHSELADGIVTVDDLKQYDFGFVSESVGTWAIVGPLKGNPIPLFFTEGYAAQANITGWASAGGSWGSTFDSTGTGGKVTIVDDTGHQLAAGFANGAELDIVTGSDKTQLLTYCVPEVDYIPIAVLSEDPTKAVVFGVEKGTALFLDDGSAIDPTVLSENRAAAVCIHANANNFITEDAYKLMDAGIQWILGEDGGPTEDFVNTPIEPQTGVFVATFNAKATADSVDGVLGLAMNE